MVAPVVTRFMDAFVVRLPFGAIVGAVDPAGGFDGAVGGFDGTTGAFVGAIVVLPMVMVVHEQN